MGETHSSNNPTNTCQFTALKCCNGGFPNSRRTRNRLGCIREERRSWERYSKRNNQDDVLTQCKKEFEEAEE